MANVMDYLEWRGDLTFEEAPLCEVDNVIFSMLVHVNLDGIVPGVGQGSITLRNAATEYFFTHDPDELRPLGLIVPTEILSLFRRMANCRRFSSLELTGYVNEIREEEVTQFCALTVRLPGEQVFVAFSGTDDTLVGWKEDFHLSFMDEIPAQRRAVEYVNALDLTPDTALYLGGHSKGGNLAIWSAIRADESVRQRVRRAFCNDGPGFTEETVNSEAYRSLSDRFTVLLPESSLIGLLLEHEKDCCIVIKSNRKGLYQHDGLSWEVSGPAFVRAEGLSKQGIRTDTVIRERINSMTRCEKQKLAELIFTVLEATGAKTLTDLHNGKFKTAYSMVKAYQDLSEEDQEAAVYLWGKLTDPESPAVQKKTAAPGSPAEPPAHGVAACPPIPQKPKRAPIRVVFFPGFLP